MGQWQGVVYFSRLEGHMFTLESTQDLLYLVLSIAVIWVSAMVAWLLFETAVLLRNVNRIVRNIRMKMIAIEQAVEGMKGKLAASAGYIALLAKGLGAVKNMMQDDDDEDRPRRRRK